MTKSNKDLTYCGSLRLMSPNTYVKQLFDVKEISSAKDENSITDLFILHSIQIQKENNRLIPNGGIIKIIENWTPEENKLKPATFHYEID